MIQYARMIYLKSFYFPDKETELDVRLKLKLTCFDTMYPFFTLSEREITELDFDPITILYGGNGCGKTTALNAIAEKLRLSRDALYNRSDFFERYIAMCDCDVVKPIPRSSAIITSDDVFDFILDVRSMNAGVDNTRSMIMDEYSQLKRQKSTFRSLDDYEELKRTVDARRKTMSKYVREYAPNNIRERSNGESAYMYFTKKIDKNALYLLDEPENSLSPERQMELMQYIENAVRFFDCQIIMSTHSPFLLSMRYAKIYDFDRNGAEVKRWTELKNVRAYYDFFKAHEKEFEE